MKIDLFENELQTKC